MSRIDQFNAAGKDLADAAEQVRSASDADLGEANKHFQEKKAEFERCRDNLSIEDEARAVKEFTPKPVDNPNKLGMDDGETRRYSLLRAMAAQMTGDWSKAGLEREASNAVARALGKDPTGFYLPLDVQERATMSVTDATYAGNLVQTDLLSGSFVDILRNKQVVGAAGAQFLSGLVGNVKIPRQTGASTAYWVAENTDITSESYPTVDQISLTPKAHGVYTDIGRQLLLQSSIDAEQFVINDLTTVIALSRDLAALSGTNANGQPLGVAGSTSVGSVACGTNGAAPTFANIVALETAVAAANADVDNMSYIMNAKARGYLKSTPKVATYSADMMWDTRSPGTPLNGYNALVTNQCRSNLTKASGTGLSEIFFGNWADLIIATWGTMDIMVNPYVGQLQGSVRVSVLEDIDIAVRHGESFARIADAIV